MTFSASFTSADRNIWQTNLTYLTYVFKMIYLVNENVAKHWKGHGASLSAKLTAAARSGQFFLFR